MPVCTVTFFYIFVLCFMSHQFSSATFLNKVEQFDNYENETEINVTAWSTEFKVHYRFIDIDVTWLQALNICETLKYGILSKALPEWVNGINVRNFLEEINYKNLNYTFWLRSFRPHLNVRKWFMNTASCEENPHLNNIENYRVGQCVAVKRNESEFSRETVFVENCNKLHPFVCIRYPGNIELLAFTGFDVTETPIGSKVKHQCNVSLEFCQTECANDTNCNSFTYLNMTDCCSFYKRQNGYGALHYTIHENKMSDATHYVKTGSVIEFINNATNISIPNVSPDLPVCGIDEVPQGYCRCEKQTETIVEQSNDIVTDIVQNLTIDKRVTSAYKRRMISSQDNRGVSTVFGVLGLLTIIVMLSLVVLADVTNLIKKWSCKQKNKTKIKNSSK